MRSEKFWQNKRVCVTGGAGFLGQVVVRKLKERGTKDIFIPQIEDFDLVQLPDINRMLADSNPNIIIHLAAQVGVIGANREYPAEFLYSNLMMGVQLMHRAWETGVEKFVAIGTICAYPKFTPVPFQEENLCHECTHQAGGRLRISVQHHYIPAHDKDRVLRAAGHRRSGTCRCTAVVPSPTSVARHRRHSSSPLPRFVSRLTGPCDSQE